MQYENSIPISTPLSIKTRIGSEWRIFDDFTPLLRWRIREGITFILTKKISLAIHDEYFINSINVNAKNIFDQNRLTIQPSFQLNKNLKLDAGFSYINAKGRTSESISINHIFYTNITYSIN